MSSNRRIEASKRNGALSQGPKTPEGKRRSSYNAIRHGLLAQCVVLANESNENFQLLLGQYIHKFTPHDDVEFGMIEDMAAAYWRLRRAMMTEKNMFDKALDKIPEEEVLAPLGAAWEQLGDSPKLLHLHRYQTMLHRMHQRALNNFLLLRDIAPDDEELPNEPIPISEHFDAPPPPDIPEPAATSTEDSPAQQTDPVKPDPLVADRRRIPAASESKYRQPSETRPPPDTAHSLSKEADWRRPTKPGNAFDR